MKVVEDASSLIFSRTGITKNRIGLVGYSLGASVALGVGAKDKDFGAIVDFSGSLPDEYFSVLKTLPPLLIIHGRDDRIVPIYNALQLAKLCDMKGLICNVQLYSGEGHFFGIAATIKSKREVEEFLKDHVPVR